MEDFAFVVLGLGGVGAPLGLAVGALLARRPQPALYVAVGVALAAVLAAAWLLGPGAATDDCEGESCGLGAFLLALALGANAVAWLVGVAAGFFVRRRTLRQSP